MLSMLLHGARQTLVIAFVAMIVRLLLGLLLGTFTGWWPKSLFDRIVTAVTGFLAAIPGLILAILLVFAIGIRRGQIAFIVALSLVGWGEITQIIRGHVLTIRKKMFVDAARAVGLGSAQILSRHVLPNLLATLLAVASLEMGGVLLLLGELGFVNVFVGGGGFYSDDSAQMGQVIHYFDVPDWGAMLGTSWRYFRAMPWLPMAPALAFLAAILGFNLFGYGLQRFIEKGRFHPSGWSVFRFFVVVAALLLGAWWLLASTGIEAQYTDLARRFDVQRAWNDISYLTQPELEGRPTGPGGGFDAAAYIAHQYKQAGLTALTNGTYYQSYEAVCGQVTAQPVFEILGPDGEPRMRLDGISFDPQRHFQAEGIREEELVVLGNPRGRTSVSEIVLMLSGSEDPRSRVSDEYYPSVSTNATILRVVPDDDLARNDLSPSFDGIFGGLSFSLPSNNFSLAHLLISETAARQLLAEAGLDLDELWQSLREGERVDLDTGLRVRVNVGLVYQEIPAVNVVGYFAAADRATEGDRILVAANYTGPIPSVGAVYPGADDNASGVAVMLEVARLWHDLGFEPKRTVVFAALDERGGNTFVNHSPLPTSPSDTWTTVFIQGVGAGEPTLARMEAGSGLAHAFDQSARRFRVHTRELEESEFFFVSTYNSGYTSSDRSYSGLTVTRPGDARSGRPADTLDHLDPALVAEAGKAIAHYLMVLSSR
jgi:peptide/nickel transport system permease protein